MNISGYRNFIVAEAETDTEARIARRRQDRAALNAIARVHPQRFCFVPGCDPESYLDPATLRKVRRTLEARKG
jgi:hypothetical protein